MEQEFPESLPVTKLDWDCDICEHASISKHEFLQNLKVDHAESQSIDKSTGKQREPKEWNQHRVKKMTSTLARNISIRRKLQCIIQTKRYTF